jgi:hypothetical protein
MGPIFSGESRVWSGRTSAGSGVRHVFRCCGDGGPGLGRIDEAELLQLPQGTPAGVELDRQPHDLNATANALDTRGLIRHQGQLQWT